MCFLYPVLHVCTASGGGGGTFGTLARAQGRYTALIRTAANGHADCLRLLLDAGAALDDTDEVRVCFGDRRECLCVFFVFCVCI